MCFAGRTLLTPAAFVELSVAAASVRLVLGRTVVTCRDRQAL